MDRIPLYSYDGSLVRFIDRKHFRRLVGDGRVQVVMRSKGRVARAILHRMPGEPRPILLRDVAGTKYCFRQHLGEGHYCYKLRALGERDRHGEDEYNLAPEEVRPIFLRVVLDCITPAAARV